MLETRIEELTKAVKELTEAFNSQMKTAEVCEAPPGVPTTEEPKEEKPKTKQAPKKKKKEDKEEVIEPELDYTETMVRDLARCYILGGQTEEERLDRRCKVEQVINQFNAKMLAEIDPAKYNEFAKALQGVINGA